MTDDNPCWVKLNHSANTAHRRTWKLTPNEGSSHTLGMLAEGYAHNPGWYVYNLWAGPPESTLPRTMGRDEAMAAAKLIILSQRSNP